MLPPMATRPVFGFLHSQQLGTPYPRLYPEGLDPAAEYRLTALDPEKAPTLPATMTGSALMHVGISLDLTGDYASTVVVLERIGNGPHASTHKEIQ